MDIEHVALPPPAFRAMVAGSEDANWFIESGRRSVADLERALAAVGRTLASFDQVLDFGCGCGRMDRWLLERGVNLTGLDIEEQLVHWCRDHLPNGSFEVGPPLLDPFQLGIVIGRKIEGIDEMANLRHSPEAMPKNRKLSGPKTKMSPRSGCGKNAPQASLEIASRFPLCPSHDDELPVTFLMSRRVLPK